MSFLFLSKCQLQNVLMSQTSTLVSSTCTCILKRHFIVPRIIAFKRSMCNCQPADFYLNVLRTGWPFRLITCFCWQYLTSKQKTPYTKTKLSISYQQYLVINLTGNPVLLYTLIYYPHTQHFHCLKSAVNPLLTKVVFFRQVIVVRFKIEIKIELAETMVARNAS